MYSDHYPIQIILARQNTYTQTYDNNEEIKKNYNFNKADRTNFAKDLNKPTQEDNYTIDELNSFIIDEVSKACDKNIPEKSKINRDKNLPKFVLDLIKHRKNLKNKIKKILQILLSCKTL